MLLNREEMATFLFNRNTTVYVPVRFHLVSKNDGSSKPSEAIPLAALCHLNRNYADLNIQFFIKEIKCIRNSEVHQNPASTSAYSAIAKMMVYDAVNVFITGESPNGTSAFYQPPAGKLGADWIVIASNYSDDPRILTHEMGHFFSLPHTFHGWENSGGWNPDIHGNPVGFLAPNGKTANEFVDGTNCKTAGDGFCDTPADYMFPSIDCKYLAKALDPKNQMLKPDLQNYMNYQLNCKEYHFSSEQKAAITRSLFHSTRDYIRTEITLKTNLYNIAPLLLAPAQNASIPTHNSVMLQWEPVRGADQYLIEVSNTALGTERFIVTNNSVTLTSLAPNTGYWWRVMGFNDFSTCGLFSATRIFRTGFLVSSSEEKSSIWKWTIQPSAVTTGNLITMQVETPLSMKAEIKLHTASGQVLFSESHQFHEGLNIIHLNGRMSQAGTYIITMRSQNYTESRKLVVTSF